MLRRPEHPPATRFSQGFAVVAIPSFKEMYLVSDPILSVRGATKVFGRGANEAAKQLARGVAPEQLPKHVTPAVIDATFDVQPGEIFVVMGLSGSGKSTLIRMLNGLWEPTTGEVKVAGTDLAKADAATIRRVRREHISMVFQHFALLPHRSVLDNVAMPLEIQGVPKQERLERAADMLERVGLGKWKDKRPSELSGGMQQRVGIARALAADTDILLMDEAFSALDPLIRREMQEELKDLQEDLQKTIIFITHDLNEAMFLGDRIAVMRQGKIVQIGTPEEILTDPANDYVAQFVQDVDRARVLTAASAMVPAASAVPLSAGPRAALRVMNDTQSGGAFVLGHGRKLEGGVTDRRAMRLVKEGSTNLASILMRDIAAVSPDTPLSELFELAADSPFPIAVVDEQRRLLGVVPRVTLLASLANIPSTTSAIPIQHDRITNVQPEEVQAVLEEHPAPAPTGASVPDAAGVAPLDDASTEGSTS